MNSTFIINRPYVRDKWKTFTPIYLPGENYSLYINFYDVPPSSSDTFQLLIIDANTQKKIGSPGGLIKLFVAGATGFHLYIQNFVFPAIPDGQYYFSALDSVTGNEAARSNLITVDSLCHDTTSFLEYRHNGALFNIRYDLLPNFWMKYRIPLNQINAPDVSSTRDTNRESSGQRELAVSKSFTDIKQTIELSWCNQLDIEAMAAALDHKEVKLDGLRLVLSEQLKAELPSFASSQMKATFPIIIKDDEPALLYSWEGILSGGCGIGYICENFFIGNIE